MLTRHTLLFALCMIFSFMLSGQITNNLQTPTSINEDGAVPDASAMLDVKSTDKGMLVPRMTTTERMQIGSPNSPATGLLVFDTDTGSFWYYDGTAWQNLIKSTTGHSSMIADSDGDTKIQAEETPGENIIRMDAAGSERLKIDADSSVFEGLVKLKSGALLAQGETGGTPTAGPGTRLMWIPEKKAFRAGEVDGTQWDDVGIGIRSFVSGGENNTASGLNSFIGGGIENIASGDGAAIAGGGVVYFLENKAPESLSGNTASGNSSFIGGGIGNEATGIQSSVTGGAFNTASRFCSSISGGYLNTASGENSFVGGGEELFARSWSEAVFGAYNTDYMALSSSGYNPDDRLFVIGNGQNATDRSNALTILKSGYTGLGTDAPKALLHTNGGAVLFDGTVGSTPVSGAGTRLMWIPEKGAFRAGEISDAQWDDGSIGNFSFAGGGRDNMASGYQSFTGGGFGNTASSNSSFVGGGDGNTASNVRSFIGGGYGNTASDFNAFVGGGNGNTASGYSSFVGGGASNTTLGLRSLIGGGNENLASGENSFVGGGHSNTASGDDSFIGGGSNGSSTSSYSFVGGGTGNHASGSLSFVGGGLGNSVSSSQSFIGGGLQNQATAENSFVGGGTYNKAFGESSFVGGGEKNTASGAGSFIGGGGFELPTLAKNQQRVVSYNTASGMNSFIGAGQYHNALGDNSGIVGGTNNFAVGKASFIGGGAHLEANSYCEAAFGLYSEIEDPISPSTFIGADRLFVIGNGEDASNRSNAVTVRKNGKIGLGTDEPNELLEATGNILIRNPQDNGAIILSPTNTSYGTDPELVIQSAETGAGFDANFHISRNAIFQTSDDSYQYIDDSGAPAQKIGFESSGDITLSGAPSGTGAASFTEHFRVKGSTGNIGIGTSSPTEKLHVVGNICFTGTSAACSDERFKTDFQPIAGALAKLRQLNGIYYHWKRDEFPEKDFAEGRQIGLIAQEVQALFPEMVLTDADGYLSVDYSRLAPVLVEVIKEQQQEIESLKAGLSELKELKAEVAEIKAMLNAPSTSADSED